jgi:hypothetical protein
MKNKKIFFHFLYGGIELLFIIAEEFQSSIKSVIFEKA